MTAFADDGCKRLITTPDGATTRYELDELGQVVAVVDALGARTSVTYDERRREFGAIVTDLVGAPVRMLSLDGALVWSGGGSPLG